MNGLSKLLWKYIRFLQISDCSLGIDIRENCMVIVKIRKTLTDLKIVSCTIIPEQNKSRQNLLAENLLEKPNGVFAGGWLNISLPLSMALVRRISIPLMKERDIGAFLSRTPELFLPLQLDLQKVTVIPEILGRTDETWKLLVFIVKRQEFERFSDLKADQKKKMNLVVGIWPWQNLCLWQDPVFSGTVRICGRDYEQWTEVQSGYITDYRKVPVKEQESSRQMDTANVKVGVYYINSQENRSSPLIKYLQEQKLGMGSTNNHRFQSDYVNAFALSLTPFFPPPAAQNSSEIYNRVEWKRQFFRQLTIKSIVVWGILSLCLYLISFIFSLGFEQYLASQESLFSDLQSLLKKREHLLQENMRLQHQLSGYGSLLQEDSHTAWYIYRIAHSIPAGAWLTQINIRISAISTPELNLSGYVLSEKELSEFLKYLEMLDFVHAANLKEVILTDPTKEKLIKNKNLKKILKFRIMCHV